MRRGSHLTFATILPGALLVAVACSQLFLTQFHGLTPAKGGGFGMFAVTDIRSSRPWSIECITEDGAPCRIVIEPGEGALGEFLGERLRTMPDAETRARAADRVFAMRYVPLDYSAFVGRFGAAAQVAPNSWRELAFFQTPFADGADHRNEPIKMRAIRLRVWRLQFDPTSDILRYEPIGGPEERGQW